jgi:hypothetical protein
MVLSTTMLFDFGVLAGPRTWLRLPVHADNQFRVPFCAGLSLILRERSAHEKYLFRGRKSVIDHARH